MLYLPYAYDKYISTSNIINIIRSAIEKTNCETF